MCQVSLDESNLSNENYSRNSLSTSPESQSHQRKTSSVRFSNEHVGTFLNGSNCSLGASKMNDTVHVHVLEDPGRRRKVESLRDAILEQQVDVWATSFEAGSTCTCSLEDEKETDSYQMMTHGDTKLAFLSWQHSARDVTEALLAAAALECSID